MLKNETLKRYNKAQTAYHKFQEHKKAGLAHLYSKTEDEIVQELRGSYKQYLKARN